MSPRLVVFTVAMFLATVWITDAADQAERARAAAVEPAAATAQARESKRAERDRRDKKKKKKKKKSKKRRASRVNRNMPKGWEWPPSSRMTVVGKACLDELDARNIGWRKASRTRKVATPITLPAMEVGGLKLVSTYRKGPFVMDCHLALGLSTFAETLVTLGVRELHFSRIHDYTQVRVNGEVKRALSRHALGIAIDVRAFVDANGHTAVVETDYPLGDPLLLSIEQALNESGRFRTILTPGNDPESHDDHYHIEVGVDYTTTAQSAL